MLAPLSWLRDFAPFDLDPLELGRVFDSLGMVVEGITHVGAGLDGVVVARVLDIRPIEGLDKVRLTTVDAGDGEPLEVACGAWNFAPGDLVPLAPVGTTLPNGMTIGRRKMRGVVSNGMLCAPDELGLGGDHAGLLVLAPGLAPGTPVKEALGIETDVLYDLAIEGNRPDANAMVGIARDAAARLGLPFRLPEPNVVRGHGADVNSLVQVRLEAPDLCPRFTVTALLGVRIGPSDPVIQRRLTLAGMRPLNNVVDASNYVMLELGQPTHPYDMTLVAGDGFVVRRARPGETLVTLDGVERVLHADDCVIADGDGAPLGIGGVMGGASAEISAGTEHVLLEAAYFDPMAIAWTSKRLQLRTEASARFERGVDPEGIHRAAERFCELVAVGETAPGTVDARSEAVPGRRRIEVRVARVNTVLGTDLGADEITGLLAPLGFEVHGGGDRFAVDAPTFRPDVRAEIDVVEEVARHHGYLRIPKTVPRSPFVGQLTARQRLRRRVRDVLAGAGIDEAVTGALVGPDDHARAGIDAEPIAAANPMVREESRLRLSLLPGLLRAVSFNVAQRAPVVRLFEVGVVFLPPAAGAELPDEREIVAAALVGEGAPDARRAWDVLVSALRLDAAGVELVPSRTEPGLHPTRTAEVRLGGVRAGHVGEVDPDVVAGFAIDGRVGWLAVDLDALLGAPQRPEQQQPISRFPSADLDLAFEVGDDIAAGSVERTLRAAGGDLLEWVELFDVYRGAQVGEGRRSLAYRLRFRALDRTLTDADLGAVRDRCIRAVEDTHGASLRG